MDKGNAADQLYTEFRNPLVHGPANDTKGQLIGKWGSIPDELHDIEKIDALLFWLRVVSSHRRVFFLCTLFPNLFSFVKFALLFWRDFRRCVGMFFDFA